MKNERLHALAKQLVVTLAQTEKRLIATLIVVQQREAFRDFHHNSLFTYAVNYLNLSRPIANMYRTVVNRAIALSPLREALEQEKISVVYASKIVSSLNPDNVEEVLEFAATHSIRQTEAWLIKEKGAVRRVNISVTTDTRELLREVKDLTPGNLDDNEVLQKVLREYFDRHDPVEKAKRSQHQAAKRKANCRRRPSKPTSSKAETQNRPITQ